MRLRLISKFTLAISAVLVATMGLFAFFSLEALERMSVKEAIKDIDNLSETILSTTFHQMLVDDRNQVYRSIDEVSTQKGIKNIRLINKDGTISYSTDSTEVGTQVDKTSAACNMCHAQWARRPLMEASSMRRSRRFVEPDGEEVLGIARGIYNQPNCATAACHVHSPEMRMLGVLDVSVSLQEMHQQIDSFRRDLAFWTIGLLILLILTLALLTRRLVHRPVDKLLAHTRLLSQGELSLQIEDVERDEMGELEEAFNDMTSNLRLAQQELKNLASSLEVKVEERTRQIQHIQSQLVRSEKLASLGELVAGIAHEINNPLTGIMVFASLALENPRLPPELLPDVETIFRETQRCAGIVQGLLEFSRETTPEKRQESVNNILEKTLRLLENQAGFLNIAIHRCFDQELPKILVDANQLNQVFINIILNAAQAMSSGGELTLTTGLDEERKQLFVRVQDTGCGIPEENLKRIFDPFFTTKDLGGTGLGLSVSYGIIENHGGTIEVESEVGKGTTFVVWLPLEAVQNQPGSAAARWVTRESRAGGVQHPAARS